MSNVIDIKTRCPLHLSHNQVFKGELVLHYSSYWGKWSRVLYQRNGTYVEVDLSPINPNVLLNWEKVNRVNIRRHCTGRDRHDKSYRQVNGGSIVHKQVLAIMEPRLTTDKIVELLHYDFLPEIDWGKFQEYNNGGCFFADCAGRLE